MKAINTATQRKASWDTAEELLPGHCNSSDLEGIFGVTKSMIRYWHTAGYLVADTPPCRGTRQIRRYPKSRVIQFARDHMLELCIPEKFKRKAPK